MTSPLPAPCTPDDVTPDASDIELLYRSERHALARFFTRNRASPDDARDLVQETFLRLARAAPPRQETIARPSAYLRQIARNLLRDRAKTAGRRAEAHHIPFDDTIPDANGIDRLEARDGLARVEAAMRSMKPKTREIFMAHRLDGLTYAQIAERTGLSIKGVEKQMSRAMAQLLRHAGGER
ncbi:MULTISPECIES: RNA polymerase sigma factor [unclassified Sphingomonas]|jgi:RNA polymerase sigma-70 factor (ECF subfamily)|uniref:RNA polymerase sigma factor n=1 Tax=unclassified Sphingomonas TaxID=196159 RepID=UPI00082BE220|nr:MULTISPECIES: sigma-70 family RNA polymerase sigma factor [unclassified Sphingomonas]